MPRFTSDGLAPVQAKSAEEAAEIFANRLARREFGRRGYCRTLRLDSWTRDGTLHVFEAFIGKSLPGDPFTTAGHNSWIRVRRD